MPAPQLPPGSRAPSLFQTIGWWTRPIAFAERRRARYGKRFTGRIVGQPPAVMLSDPEDVKAVFTAPADVLHPGEGARIMEPLLGRTSILLLDGAEHLERRRLMLPAFHGERIAGLERLLEEVAEREVASWPREQPVAMHPRAQHLALEVILRAVFGLEPGPRLDRLRELLRRMLVYTTSPVGLVPALQHDLGPLSPWGRFLRLRAETDAAIFELVDERRAEQEPRDDLLSMLLAARYEDGEPLSRQELRDQLITLLVAGHETTASQLAWAFERLPREPRVLARLAEEVRAGEDDAYLTATVHELLRRHPVVPTAVPRIAQRDVEIGGWTYPAGTYLIASSYLVHHDPEIYPEPYAFRPERFLGTTPGTYTWIPFGGGRRRCLGASFAMLEIKVVLRAVLRVCDLEAAPGGPERARRRLIALSPARGAATVLRDRVAEPGTERRPVAVA